MEVNPEEVIDTYYFIRHPSIVEIINPQGQRQVCPKTITLGRTAPREILEYFWIITQRSKAKGVTDVNSLRTFSEVYSTPAVRGVFARLLFPEGVQIQSPYPGDINYEKRQAEKWEYYHKLKKWTIADKMEIPRIIEAEIQAQQEAHSGVRVLDELSESLEVPPRFTGAAMQCFVEEMFRQRFSMHSIYNLHKALKIITTTAKDANPQRKIIIVHGSTLYAIREACEELLHGPVPSPLLKKRTYRELKHMGHPGALINHGCGIEILLNRNRKLISLSTIDITQAMSEPFLEAKKRMFIE